jgi:alkylation response protein AidB-like acyl-CoA dehydrogenase
MSSENTNQEIVRGCSFLVEDHPLSRIFTPEDFDEDQRMIGQLMWDFVEGTVLPKLEAIEAREEGLTVSLLKQAGELGLLGVDLAEKYGGFEQTKAVTMLLCEKMVKGGSFQVSLGGHTGIGTLPIVYFGTPEQKQKYLPRLATGELLGAYALTEAGSGSDALAAKSTALLTEDGKHYVLNGEKMYITNAGFADLFVVFAKVDGDLFSAFLLEKGMEGLKTGAEEKKMGIKGSSTRTLIMEDVLVPVENLLGEVGKGAKIAFNILNVGRFKLGAGTIGGAIDAILTGVKYGNQRRQFGHPITDFGLIKHKIGEAAGRIFAGRSMVYRTAGYIDQNIATLDKEDPEYDQKVVDIAIREYMGECSMIKVFGSEVLDYCVDENLQIHGGYGYSEDYPAERFYRDSRINRIFEGTNEINRLIVGGEVFKKAAKNELPIFPQAKALLDELMGTPSLEEPPEGFLADEALLVSKAKKTIILCMGALAQELGPKLSKPWAYEEVFALLADMIMDAYGMESALLRTRKMMERGDEDQARLAGKMTSLFCNEAIHRIEIWARNLLAAGLEGDMLTTTLVGLRRIVKHQPVNTVALRREIANQIIEKEAWPF